VGDGFGEGVCDGVGVGVAVGDVVGSGVSTGVDAVTRGVVCDSTGAFVVDSIAAGKCRLSLSGRKATPKPVPTQTRVRNITILAQRGARWKKTNARKVIT
jgi:hypothetical protein